MGVSRSDTVSEIAEAVMIDRNSKEHSQSEVNQNELPQLKKHSIKNKKCQGRSHIIYCQARPSSKSCTFIL